MSSNDDPDLNAARERIKRYIKQHPEHADHFKTVDGQDINEPPGRLSWPADDLSVRRDLRDDLEFLEKLEQKDKP